MATAEAYVKAVLAYGVWMVGYIILLLTAEPLVGMALDLGGDFIRAPANWYLDVLDNWPLIGLMGLFFSMLAPALTSSSGGGY